MAMGKVIYAMGPKFNCFKPFVWKWTQEKNKASPGYKYTGARDFPNTFVIIEEAFYERFLKHFFF